MNKSRSKQVALLAFLIAAKKGIQVRLLIDSYGSALKGLAKELDSVVAQMQAIFSEDWVFTTGEILDEITLDAWKHRGVPTRLAELVFWIWEPYC